MLLIAHVAAEFHDALGTPIFTISRHQLNTFLTAPDAIRQDPLFAWLVRDGSIETADTTLRQKSLENDPVSGTNAEGKRAVLAAASDADSFGTRASGKRPVLADASDADPFGTSASGKRPIIAAASGSVAESGPEANSDATEASAEVSAPASTRSRQKKA